MIVRLAAKIGQYHARLFNWLGHKAHTNWVFALLLTLLALYEIFEHLAGPILAWLFATGQLTFQ